MKSKKGKNITSTHPLHLGLGHRASFLVEGEGKGVNTQTTMLYLYLREEKRREESDANSSF